MPAILSQVLYARWVDVGFVLQRELEVSLVGLLSGGEQEAYKISIDKDVRRDIDGCLYTIIEVESASSPSWFFP